MTWDNSQARLHRCDLATAVATEDGVRLCFGAIARGDDRAEVARLLAEARLSPDAARHLRRQLAEMLGQ